MKILFKFVPFLIIVLSVCIFFYPFFIKEKIPIPADTIIGLFNPFRDLYAKDYPKGIPYKNFLITDPVEQQYLWKNLVIDLEKNLKLPLWNPYALAGTPLLGNFQSSPFYPLNIILFVTPFYLSWGIFIFLQQILGGIFLYLYLRQLKLDFKASILGSITWIFSGFFIVWLEWGVIGHTILWLPLILLSIDKGFFNKRETVWKIIFLFSLCSGFLAGHLQIFFYVFIFSSVYFFVRFITSRKDVKTIFSFVLLILLFTFLTFIQWLPTLQFILLSGRNADQTVSKEWFIALQHLIQFVAPDFFGNPATLNYWGVWNYAEFVGYIGIGSLILALFASVFRHDKKTYFFLAAVIASLILSTNNPIAHIPFMLHIPFFSTSQPTRLLSIICFGLAVLSALGLDMLIKKKAKNILVPICIVGIIVFSLWISVIFGKQFFTPENQLVARNNLKFPTLIFLFASLSLLSYVFATNKNVKRVIIVLFFVVVFADLLRFGWKFTPFTNREYIFPQTKVINFLQAKNDVFRIVATDRRILPPNFSVFYRLQSIEGYDPLYLQNYGELIAANERDNHSIKPPFGYSRIITPHNIYTPIIDLLNVKYVLSLTEIQSPKFKKVFQEGETIVYENKNVIPRTFFVDRTVGVGSRQEIADGLFKQDLLHTALLIGKENVTYSIGQADITFYEPNMVRIDTVNSGQGFLVLSDAYFPSIHATIDGVETKIIPVNLAFRGIVIPAGKHIVVFEAKLF